MDRHDTERRDPKGPKRHGGRHSRAGLASGVPGTHPDGPEPGHGFEVEPPRRTVSTEATEHAPRVDPERGFAVPAPSHLATQTLERPGRHERPAVVRHPFLTNRHRPIPDTKRFGLAAGQVLVAMFVCFLVWTLLSAHALHKESEAAPDGARRDASLAFLGPVDGLTHLLFIDRLAAIFQGAVGHDPNKVSPGGLADQPGGPPPPQPSLLPTTGPANPRPTGSHNGNGNNGNGNNGNGHGHKHHPSPQPTKPGTGGSALPLLRVPTAAKPLKVLVVGDSFAEDVELGLAPITDSKYFRIIEKGLHSTGLARPDYYNWPNALAVFMQNYHPDIVIVMVGGNDAQTVYTLSGDKIPFGVGDPRWPKLYTQRVNEMMNEASADGTHVVWLGMPIMGNEAFSRNIHYIDGIYADQAKRHPNVLYIDTWSLFADKNGHYADYLPDRNGNLVLVRASDKVHLSSAGNHILMGVLIRAMKDHAGWHLSPKALG
ncbi:MAG TPA: DUF459 domain-containing protein [Actinomycetota bacterium]|nr:DUF459 domain-containing protein [Actinomycetota bacterium]